MTTVLDSAAKLAVDDPREAGAPPASPPPRQAGQRRWFWRWPTWVAALVLVAIVAGTWLFYFSSTFTVKHIVVDGVLAVSPDRIADEANIPAGERLTAVDLDAVRAHVSAIPRIGTVEVSRRWPDTVVIRVVERTPVATTPVGDEWAVIDATGTAYQTRTSQPPNLPLVEASDPVIRSAAIESLAAMPKSLRSQVVRITGESVWDLRLAMRSGQTVLWGSAADSGMKAEVLRALMAATNDSWLDVRVPEFPTSSFTQPRPAPPPEAVEADEQAEEASAEGGAGDRTRDETNATQPPEQGGGFVGAGD